MSTPLRRAPIQGSARSRAREITPLLISVVLNPLNSTLITVALVPIGHAFDVGPTQTAWLITSLYLASAVAQPILGQFVDRFGARRILLAGSVLVAIAGLGGLLAPTLGWLVAVRVLLGIATCAGFPATMAVLRRHAEQTGTGPPSRTLSLVAVTIQTIMVLGPALGGAMISMFGWQSIFAVNIPLGLAGIALTLAWVPPDDMALLKRGRIDTAGILLFSAGLLSTLFFLMKPSIDALPLLAAAGALGAALVWRELRTDTPFIDLRMLRASTPLLRTYLRQALGLLIVYSVLFGYVQWLQTGRRLNESAAGLLLLPMSVVAMLAAAASGRPNGVRGRLVLSSLALLAGSIALLLVNATTSVGLLLVVAGAFGLGQGLMGVSNQTMLYRQTPAGAIGATSGLFRSAQYLGGVAASTLIALCYGSEASSAGLHHLGWSLTAIAAVLLLVTALDPRLRPDATARKGPQSHNVRP
ncbi:MFS transporter [Streptomyces sp. NPDC001027]|uniref:MFS transporter n=1 Tax=Streptomyces sp. NPDC001027 TaxID=3154771 RepID=UPI003320B63C